MGAKSRYLIAVSRISHIVTLTVCAVTASGLLRRVQVTQNITDVMHVRRLLMELWVTYSYVCSDVGLLLLHCVINVNVA